MPALLSCAVITQGCLLPPVCVAVSADLVFAGKGEAGCLCSGVSCAAPDAICSSASQILPRHQQGQQALMRSLRSFFNGVCDRWAGE
jgi:hypothetical protein